MSVATRLVYLRERPRSCFLARLELPILHRPHFSVAIAEHPFHKLTLFIKYKFALGRARVLVWLQA